MQETSKIKIDISEGTFIISVTSTIKNTELTDGIAYTSEIKNFIQSESLLLKLKKCIDQQKKQDSRPITKVVTSELNIECFNSNLTWEKAYLDADFIKTSQLPYGLSLLELIRITSHTEQEVLVETMYIETNREKIAQLIIENFPVMLASKRHATVLINYSESVLHPDTFATIMESEEDSEHENVSNEPRMRKSAKEKPFGPTKKRGRKALHKMYPNLVPIIINFIKQPSFSAHGSRRESTGTGTLRKTLLIFYFCLQLFL